MNVMNLHRTCLLLICFLVPLTTTQVSIAAEKTELKLPAEPVNWINSAPLNSEMLKGKAALFYLFEEG